jgi:hypothetical protein
MIRLLVCCVTLLSLALAGCQGLSIPAGWPTSSTDLGPDSAAPAISPADASGELKAGVAWLWQSVARLQTVVETIKASAPAAAVALSTALDGIRADCTDADAAAKGDDVAAARTKWRTARAAVGRLAIACLSAAATHGLSQLADALGGGQ